MPLRFLEELFRDGEIALLQKTEERVLFPFGSVEAASYDLLNGSGTHPTAVVNGQLRAYVEVVVPNLKAGVKTVGVQIMAAGLTSAPVSCTVN